jgi:hypothetical protein
MDFPIDYMAQLQGIYPERLGDNGWHKVRMLIPRLGSWGYAWATILKGAQNYRLYCDQKGSTGSDFVMKASHFFDDRECLFAEYAAKDYRSPKLKAEELEWIALEDRAKVLGFTQVDRARGLAVARFAVEQAEQRKAAEVLQLAGVKLRVVGQ